MPNEPSMNWTWRATHFALGALGITSWEVARLSGMRLPLWAGFVGVLILAAGKEFLLDTFGPEHDGWGLKNPDKTDASTADFLGYLCGAIVGMAYIWVVSR